MNSFDKISGSKNGLVILLLFFYTILDAQYNYEWYHNEDDLIRRVGLARTPMEKIYALSILAKFYGGQKMDSLLEKSFEIAKQKQDPNLLAYATWWDEIYCERNLKAEKLIQLADKYNIIPAKIMANVALAEDQIHTDLSKVEMYGLRADSLINSWHEESFTKDSIKIKAYKTLAHGYIHKLDGKRSIRFILGLREFADNIQNESLKMQAIYAIADMYAEWRGHERNGIPWRTKLYRYYKSKRQPNKELAHVTQLAWEYCNIIEIDSAKKYFNRSDLLRDSLNVFGFYLYHSNNYKSTAGLITQEEYWRILEDMYGGRLKLPPKTFYSARAYKFMALNRPDSALFYIKKLQALGESATQELLEYYRVAKQYDKRLEVLLIELDKAKNSKSLSRVRDAYWRLGYTCNLKKDFKKSVEYLMLYRKLRDSVEVLDDKQSVFGLELEKQIQGYEATLSQQRELQKAELAKVGLENQFKSYVFISGIIILLVIACLLWFNNRQKHKAAKEIERAYLTLKSTQTQLIQSEKMASLGELTAGIAHEIQNPLNFVNNFSEVNSELIDELNQALASGNRQSAEQIAKNIKENHEKINHHGKRADGIVKNMLQHSRVNSGQKELTDINALCDEYLRLSYHGLRAKDKSFNAKFETNFDPKNPKIKVVPQDLGRVILNLINNAFYSVGEKVKKQASGYEPQVKVSTKDFGDKVEISVKDNGFGIPDSIKEKIFQPFFTTKPSGQGTGLGLSLAYDIIKAHGGDIAVTEQKEGSEFIIKLTVDAG